MIESNRMVWAKNPTLDLTAGDGAVTFTMDGEVLWPARVLADAVGPRSLDSTPGARALH